MLNVLGLLVLLGTTQRTQVNTKDWPNQREKGALWARTCCNSGKQRPKCKIKQKHQQNCIYIKRIVHENNTHRSRTQDKAQLCPILYQELLSSTSSWYQIL